MPRVLPLLLSFLVLCAQSAGLLHGISHAAAPHGGAQTLHPHAVAAAHDVQVRKAISPPLSTDHGCDKCYQYAQFSSWAATQPPSLLLARSGHACAGVAQGALAACDTPACRNRGPPLAV